jgi:hypothetical protein
MLERKFLKNSGSWHLRRESQCTVSNRSFFAMKTHPAGTGSRTFAYEADTAYQPFDSIPDEVLTRIVSLLDSTKAVGAASLVDRRFADAVNENMPHLIRSFLGQKAGLADAAYFVRDMKDAGKIAHLEDILGLLRRFAIQRTECDLVIAGLITQSEAEAMKKETFDRASSDEGIMALARGFATAGNIEAFLDDPARSVLPALVESDVPKAADQEKDQATASLIRKLARAGYDPQVKIDKSGVTSLMLAAAGGLVETVQTLLELNADIHATTSKGHTGLMFAILAKHGEVARALIAAGADVNVRGAGNISVLRLASKCLPETDLIEVLLDAGLKDVDPADSIRACKGLRSTGQRDLSGRLQAVTIWR